MRKIVVAIDSFKGCLSSVEAGEAAVSGIKSVCPQCEVVLVPIADGGEGIMTILVDAAHGSYRKTMAHNPLMRPIETTYGVSADGTTAYIEMAAISGLPLLEKSEYNPLITTTYGTGELIWDALDAGIRHFVVGLGGSATNDGGIGMLQALGFRFADADGTIDVGAGGDCLHRICSIDDSVIHPMLKQSSFTIACDVRNPYCGPEGAAYTFGRQKGANDYMISSLDAGLRSFAKVIADKMGRNIADVPGAGAAGGLGGAFLAFLPAKLEPGIDLLLATLQFDKLITGAELIITGEGRVDRQSVMGKAPSGILAAAQRQQIPVVLIAGSVEDADVLAASGFSGSFSVLPTPVSLEKAMQPCYAKENISRTVSQIVTLLNHFVKV